MHDGKPPLLSKYQNITETPNDVFKDKQGQGFQRLMVATAQWDSVEITESETPSNRDEEDLTFSEAASQKLAFKAGMWLQLYYLPAAILLGVVGNTLCFLVMCRVKFPPYFIT